MPSACNFNGTQDYFWEIFLYNKDQYVKLSMAFCCGIRGTSKSGGFLCVGKYSCCQFDQGEQAVNHSTGMLSWAKIEYINQVQETHSDSRGFEAEGCLETIRTIGKHQSHAAVSPRLKHHADFRRRNRAAYWVSLTQLGMYVARWRQCISLEQ